MLDNFPSGVVGQRYESLVVQIAILLSFSQGWDATDGAGSERSELNDLYMVMSAMSIFPAWMLMS